MGYVERPYIKNGTEVQFEIRKKMIDAQVTKMPFVPTKYFIKKWEDILLQGSNIM